VQSFDAKKDGLPYSELILPFEVVNNQVTFRLRKSNQDQIRFEFYGISLETEQDAGITLHNVGIGGSQYNCLLRDVLLLQQLPSYKPDLIILDYGTNDILYYNRIDPKLESEIKKIIEQIRSVVPEATILLTSTMDMSFRRRNVTAALTFSNLIKRIAIEQNCPFYDWYWVSGGKRSIGYWLSTKLAQPDGVHMNISGATVKGNLLADAFLYLTKNDSQSRDTLLIENPNAYQNYTFDHLYPQIKTTNGGKSSKNKVYIVKKGDTIGKIARKYHVSIKELKQINGLKSDKINAKQKLKIPFKMNN
jgi:lysophospholipase L1-like esterase